MTADHDLVVIDADYQGAYQSLDRIASGFEANAQVADDVRDALGHPGLATEFKTFSDSWRLKREAMQKSFETLAKEIRTNYETWSKLDRDLGGGTTQSAPDTRDTSSAGPTPSGPTQSSSAGDSGSAPTSATSGSDARPPLSTPTAPASGPVNGGDDAPAQPVDATTSADGSNSPVGSGEGVAAPVAGAMTGAAVLGAIYSIWRGVQDSKASGPGGTSGTDDGLSVRDRIERELAGMAGVAESGYDVELSADPKDPDDIMAVLRGEDGDTVTLSMDDGDLDGAGAPDGVSELPQPSEGTSGTGSADGAGAAPPDSSDGGTLPATADDGADPLAAPVDPGASDASSAEAHAGGFPSDNTRLPDVDLPAANTFETPAPEVAAPASQAGAAGVGMMGMGALGAQHAMSTSAGGAPATHRSRTEDLKPAEPVASDRPDNEEKK